MSGYTVNPKDLQYPEGSGGRDESTNHFQDPSYEDIHGPFRPGSVNYTMSGSDESNLCTYTYNDNTYHQKAAKAVAAPGNEAADLSNFYYCQLPPRSNSVSYFSKGGKPLATETEDLDRPADGVRRHDTWADEDLDRHTAPRGCGKMGQKCGLPRSEDGKKKGEKKKQESRSGN
ncbi:hypothetical protein PG988_002016 [Apiospora saccharicola]